jgi:hypothetical protein
VGGRRFPCKGHIEIIIVSVGFTHTCTCVGIVFKRTEKQSLVLLTDSYMLSYYVGIYGHT